MAIIDADAHVLESEHTWDYMLDSEREFRPKIIATPNDADSGGESWLGDGRLHCKAGKDGGGSARAGGGRGGGRGEVSGAGREPPAAPRRARRARWRTSPRASATWTSWKSTSRCSEEHTSELQSLAYLVCRLLLEK